MTDRKKLRAEINSRFSASLEYLDDTEHLLSSKRNRDRLKSSISQMDWSQHVSPFPKAAIRFPTGDERISLIARMRKAFGKIGK